MKARVLLVSFIAVLLMMILMPSGRAQSQQPNTDAAPPGPPTTVQGEPEASPGRQQGRGRPLFGKISAIQSDALEITRQDGTKVSIKLTSSTEFRKERQPAKIGDFKVGDAVIVRSNQDSQDSSGATALMVALVPPGFTARGGMNGPGGGMPGTMGKDYVVGEVKSVEPPKLTVLRTDNVTQALELNEETSLRRGRDSITMADIQPGDHIVARGAVANDVFVPKGVNVIPPEQWKRMQEMGEGRGTRGAAPQGSAAPATPAAPPQNPPEQHN